MQNEDEWPWIVGSLLMNGHMLHTAPSAELVARMGLIEDNDGIKAELLGYKGKINDEDGWA